MAGKEWREEILKGVDKVEFPGCVCGSIIVYGEKSEAIVANEQGQVLCAAAEFGKGRIVIFSHGMFVKSCKKNLKEGKNERFIENIKNWVCRAKFNDGEIISLKEFLQKRKPLSPKGNIVFWTGDISTTKEEIGLLLEWINNGGGLICGVCPWGFLSVNNIKLESMPLYFVFDKVGVVYAGKETYKSDNNKTVIKDMATDCIKPAEIIQATRNDENNCSRLCNLIEHLPDNLYDMYRKDIFDILQKLEEKCHFTPSKIKPVDTSLGKQVAILKCRVMIVEGLRGRQVNCEGIDHFPGVFACPPELICVKYTRNCDGRKYHPTGCYLPAGNVMKVTWCKSKKPWQLYIGPHKGKLVKVKHKLRRWPLVSMKLELEAGSSSAEICSPFGGLLYLKSPTSSDMIEYSFTNVVEAPKYTYESAPEWEVTERLKPGLWCDIIGDKISFTLPSSSIRCLPDPSDVMHWWDTVVCAHIELRGKDPFNGKEQWLIADEQLFLDGAYMISGYPIMTHLDIVSPKKKEDDFFILDKENLEKNGAWGIFHEIGHNFQDQMWTWKETTEVTVNIFTLHAMDIICNISPWKHPWLRRQFDKSRDFLQVILKREKNAAEIQDWYDNPGVTLMVYAQLARDFGWEAYKTVFKNYDSLPNGSRPKSKESKENMWIVMFSTVVERNLCPLFDFWGWKMSDDTLAKTKSFSPYLPHDETTVEFAKFRATKIADKYGISFQ